MPYYIALLRGINVSGHKIIKMEVLRAAFEGLGFTNVKTYVQSGNVVFQSPKVAAKVLGGKIEKKIAEEFGFDVPVFVTTPDELAEVIQGNPLVKLPDVDLAKLHVTFLLGKPPEGALEKLRPLAAASEQLQIVRRHVYFYCPAGYGNTKLSNTAIEKKLSVGATTRNWKTVNTLRGMAG